MKYTEFNHREYESHMLVYNLIKPYSKVLDLGCATGYFAKELKKKHCDVTGIEFEKNAVKQAQKWCVHAYQGDLEHVGSLHIPAHTFHYVLLLDVLEHIQNRNALLSKIRQWLNDDGKLIISTPNIAHISIRLKLLFGDFTYTEYGILDRTHVHFFTKKTLYETLTKAGFIVENIESSSDFGQIPIIGRVFRHIPKRWQYYVTKWMEKLLAVQYVFICRAGLKPRHVTA